MKKLSDRFLIYILLCCGCVTISFNVAAIAAAIPEISRDIGVSDVLAAQLMPYYMIPYGIGALIYAPLTRKFSYKHILIVAVGLFVVASLYAAQGQTIRDVCYGRGYMGITGAAVIPLGLIIIGQLFEKNVRGRLVGGFFSCSFVASIVGIATLGVADWRLLFYIPAGLGAVTVLGLLIFKTDALKKVHGAHVDYLRAFKVTEIRNVFLFIFFISLFYHGVHKWFGVYLSREYHLEKAAISVFFILMSIGGAGGQLLGGFISDLKNRYTACLIGLVLLGGCTISLIGVYPIVVLGAILVLLSVGWTIGHNGISTVLTDFPEDKRPEIASLNSSVRFVSGGLGVMASSYFVEQSFGGTFFVIGLLMLGMAFLLKKVIPGRIGI